MKKLLKWAIVVGMPKMKYWKDHGCEPDMSNVGLKVMSYTFATRREARAEAKKSSNINPGWHYNAIKLAYISLDKIMPSEGGTRKF